MKYDIESVVDCVKALNNLAELLPKTNVKMGELETVANWSPAFEHTLSEFRKWFKVSTPVEKRQLSYLNVYVDNRGRVFNSNTDEEYEPFFYKGDMRVRINGDLKRVIDLVAVGFNIYSPEKDQYMKTFKNGDRRDLRPENITFVAKIKEDENIDKIRLVEDICRRIVQYNGNIDTVLTQYVNSYPKVSRGYIETILNKEVFADISDIFFQKIGDEIVAVDPSEINEETNGTTGFDVYGYLVATKDTKMTKTLLLDKIKSGNQLSEQEKIILCCSCSTKNNYKPEWFVDEVNKEYSYDIDIALMKKLLAPSAALQTIRDIYMEKEGK